MANHLPLMIFGLPGVPGYSAYYYFKSIYPAQVFAQKPSHQNDFIGENILTLDAENGMEARAILKENGIRFILDASGCCALKSCEYNPEMAKLVNLDFGVEIAKASRKLNIPLVRLSTDMVFDGTGNGNYVETDPISPITVYGKTMAEAEKQILNEQPEASIFRISLPMGPSHSGHAGAIDWIESRFKKNRPATLYYDEIRSSFYVQDMLKVFKHWFQNPKPGVFHLGGPLPLSLNNIAQLINKLGNYPPELLHGCLRHEAGPIPPRIGNVSMDISKLSQEIPEGTLRPWPRDKIWIPDSKEWHFQRDELIEDGISKFLYGYHSDREEKHPVNWAPNPQHHS